MRSHQTDNVNVFTFSMRNALRHAWHIYWKHAALYSLLSLIMLMTNISERSEDHGYLVVRIASVFVALVVSYMSLSMFLSAVDGKEDMLQLRSIPKHLPTFRQFIMILEVGILVALCICAGFIAFIIPAIYVFARLVFAQLVYVDRQGSAIDSLRYSWYLVQREVVGTVLKTLLVFIALLIVGVIFFGIGLIIMYPLAMLLLTILYRRLCQHDAGNTITHVHASETGTEASYSTK